MHNSPTNTARTAKNLVKTDQGQLWPITAILSQVQKQMKNNRSYNFSLPQTKQAWKSIKKQNKQKAHIDAYIDLLYPSRLCTKPRTGLHIQREISYMSVKSSLSQIQRAGTAAASGCFFFKMKFSAQ
jgi:hypothetical protein